MELNSVTYRVLLYSIIIFSILGCRKPQNEEKVTKDPESYNKAEIVSPIQENNESKTYEILDFKLTLSNHLIVRKSIGYHGELIYSIKYPGGASVIIELYSRPYINNLLNQLIIPEYYNKYRDKRSYPLKASTDSLFKYGTYYRQYQNKEYDYDQEFMNDYGKYAIEATAIDSTFIWYHYPIENKNGEIDIIYDQNQLEGTLIHIYAKTNKYLSYEKIKQSADEFLGLKNAPQHNK